MVLGDLAVLAQTLLVVGLCGHWGAAPATAAMGRPAVVGSEFGSNDLLRLQATAGFDPEPTFRLLRSRRSNVDLVHPTFVPIAYCKLVIVEGFVKPKCCFM